MLQFCIPIYANYTILATQKGGHDTMPPPLNTPLPIGTQKLGCRQKSMLLFSMLLEKNGVVKFGPKNVISTIIFY